MARLHYVSVYVVQHSEDLRGDAAKLALNNLMKANNLVPRAPARKVMPCTEQQYPWDIRLLTIERARLFFPEPVIKNADEVIVYKKVKDFTQSWLMNATLAEIGDFDSREKKED